ncbi:hypothetical protein V6N12_060162 [Hibiscus sabdariffa]|uniref:Uncharacterized protein n=1 Tax=Hibiscus sabdariffa TaxID=183260 RepID=A0ABR2D3N3_9ROSI
MKVELSESYVVREMAINVDLIVVHSDVPLEGHVGFVLNYINLEVLYGFGNNGSAFEDPVGFVANVDVLEEFPALQASVQKK